MARQWLRTLLFTLLVLPNLCLAAGDSLRVHTITIAGNERTKAHVILREIPIEEGELLSMADFKKRLQQAESNLRSSGLFNFVEIEHRANAKPFMIGENEVHVQVVERWYLWPVPILENAEPNFNTWWQTRRLDRTNYGIDFLWNNFRGRREHLRALVRLGFTEQVALEYHVPYLTKGQNLGLIAEAGFSRNREVNAFSAQDVRQFLKDNDRFLREVVFGTAGISRRFGVVHRLQATMGYQQVSIADSLQASPYSYLPNDGTESQFLTLSAHFKTDKRDYLHYPTQGYMFEVQATQYGLGLLDNSPEFLDLEGGVHGHQRVGERASASAAVLWKWNVDGTQPYYLQRGLGYQTRSVRGYELNVMDGQSYAVLKTGLRYQVIGADRISLPVIGKQEFSETLLRVYITGHFDVGYVDDALYTDVNTLANEWQYGGGIGLDFVTYYDKVARVEFSVNRFGESGFFLHFTKPI